MLKESFVNSYSEIVPPFGGDGLGWLTYRRTYARVMDDGAYERWYQTVARCVNGAQKIGAGLTEEEEQELYHLMFNLKGSVSGRALWQLGTDMVDQIGMGSLINCLGGETRILTRDGTREIRDCLGVTTLMTENGKWVESEVRNFGKQKLYKVRLTRNKITKDLYCTKGHRHYIAEHPRVGRSVVTTSELKPGMRLSSVVGQGVSGIRPSAVGIQHGIVFGDGSKRTNVAGSYVTLCGAKDQELLKWFPNSPNFRIPKVGKFIGVRVTDLPTFFKEEPDLRESKSYLYGWLAGYFAADGHISKNSGHATISSAKKSNLQLFRDVCTAVGIGTHPICKQSRIGIGQSEPSDIYSVSIMADTLTRDFFLIEKHRDSFDRFHGVRPNEWIRTTSRGWKVVSVEETDRFEDVYCAVVPDTHSFVLEDNILTGNCWYANMESIESFEFLMDNLMHGGGVGFSVERSVVHELPKIKSNVKITHVRSNDATYIVPDSREGWSWILRQVLKSYFNTGKSFTYSTILIREFGAPLKRFGGTASGPGALVDGIADICKIMDDRGGKKLRSLDVLDICNIIGRVVVAGSSRRSSELSIGDPDDFLFLRAKRWDKFNIPAWRSNSNNSIYVDSYDQVIDEVWNGYHGNGEPYGLINRKLARKIGRLGERVDDGGIDGFNPCFRGDQRFLTPDGWVRFDEAEGKSVTIIQDARVLGSVVNGKESWSVSPYETGCVQNMSPLVMKTGVNKHVVKVNFRCGRHLVLTDDHEIATDRGMVRADSLKLGDTVLVGMPHPHISFAESKVNDGYEWMGKHKTLPGFVSTCWSNDYLLGAMRRFFNHWIYVKVANPGEHDLKRYLIVNAKFCDSAHGQYLSWVLGLQRLGIFAEIWNGAARISDPGSIDLFLSIMGEGVDPFRCYDIKNTTKVSFVEDAGRCDVYCLKEDVRRTVVVNGITARRCAEIGLNDRECCNLAEIFLPRIESWEQLFRMSELLYKVQKAITSLDYPYKSTLDVVRRNRRLGQGVTGWMQATPEQISWLDPAYLNLRDVDKKWSKYLGVNESIKLTTAKPSGCRPVDAMTLCSDGILCMDELFDQHVAGLEWSNVSGKSVSHGDGQTASISKTYDNGIAKTVSVRLSYNLEFFCTENHRWFVKYDDLGSARIPINDWVQAVDLQPGYVLDGKIGAYTNTTHAKLQSCNSLSIRMRGDFTEIRQPTEMNEDIAWFLGYLWGDGCMSPGGYRVRFTDEHIFNLEKVQRILRNEFGIDGIRIHQKPNSKASILETGSKHLWSWLVKNGCFKYISDSIDRIPRCVRSSSRSDIIAFLCGFMDSDGCVFRVKRNNNPCLIGMTFGTADPKLAEHIQHVAWAVGIITGRSHQTGGSSFQKKRSFYHLRITNSKDMDDDVVDAMIKNSNKIQWKMSQNPGSIIRSRRGFGLVPFKVVSVSESAEQPTYDIEVPDGHWYYATCVKSHNTLSLMPFVTPGIHPAYSEHFIRRIRLGSTDPLADVCRASGYQVKYDIGLDGRENHSLLVVEFPCQMKGALTASQVTAITQLEWVKKAQTIWSDNAVSVTVYYKKEELPEIKEWLKNNYEDSIKSVSFLLHSEHGFNMAPYEEITEDEYLKMKSKIKPLQAVDNVGDGDLGMECEGGACPIK